MGYSPAGEGLILVAGCLVPVAGWVLTISISFIVG